MAQLLILGYGTPAMLCVVSGVPMPDGTKRIYSETGRNALAHIYERILLDKAFIRNKVRAKARRIARRLAS